MTERIMEAVRHLNRAEHLLVMEGVFDNLEQLVGWSPHYYAQKLEKEQAALRKEVARLRQALELIASPERPDGTYNRGREACELLAKEALKAEIEKPIVKDSLTAEPTPEWDIMDHIPLEFCRQLERELKEEYTELCGEKVWLKIVDGKRAGTNTRLRL